MNSEQVLMCADLKSLFLIFYLIDSMASEAKPNPYSIEKKTLQFHPSMQYFPFPKTNLRLPFKGFCIASNY